ncbi:hypothetical protein CUR178_01730 [Leishmania enriettii]|uniref:Uncharacterized protein n=1 Tax=Leishmania enriettii TaxID=5663 RepID=A0A836GB79_LEIEN|nr:hypothetical protein CUR178_01730 [Leishmania enriettii]
MSALRAGRWMMVRQPGHREDGDPRCACALDDEADLQLSITDSTSIHRRREACAIPATGTTAHHLCVTDELRKVEVVLSAMTSNLSTYASSRGGLQRFRCVVTGVRAR